MPLYVKASQWADQQGLPRHVVYREFHARGYVTDRSGNRVHAERAPGGKGIHVYPDGPPDPLAAVSAEALVAKLESAGYVVLTRDQAARLGVVASIEPPAQLTREDVS